MASFVWQDLNEASQAAVHAGTCSHAAGWLSPQDFRGRMQRTMHQIGS